MAKKMRIELDALGEVEVPAHAYYGSQTARSLENFKIGSETMPIELIYALCLIKKAAAITNEEYGLLPRKKVKAIIQACNEILEGKFNDQFPLVIWQTGSGTQTNMNVNEVIATRANELLTKKRTSKQPVHPNDDVNRSQSSNDVFPSAIHIAASFDIENRLLVALRSLEKALKEKSIKFKKIIKTGRTHLMDASPLTLGQEFSGYSQQVASGIKVLKESLKELHGLALGATAVGTGINAPKNFGKAIAATLSKLTKNRFVQAENLFSALSTSDAIVTASSSIKRVACTLYKIANDIRWMASGPRSGLGELELPANEPGSSIMPGKVNPTQSEALMMVATQIIGYDTSISIAATQGNFELNVMRPLMAYNLLRSIHLLTDAVTSFTERCLKGLRPNLARIQENLSRSLMLATALNPVIGYDKATKLVQKAHKENITLKEAAIALGLFTAQEFDRLVDPKKMC